MPLVRRRTISYRGTLPGASPNCLAARSASYWVRAGKLRESSIHLGERAPTGQRNPIRKLSLPRSGEKQRRAMTEAGGRIGPHGSRSTPAPNGSYPSAAAIAIHLCNALRAATFWRNEARQLQKNPIQLK